MKSSEQSASQTIKNALDNIADLIDRREVTLALDEARVLMRRISPAWSSIELGQLRYYTAEALYFSGDYAAALDTINAAIDDFRYGDAHQFYARSKSRRAYILMQLGQMREAEEDLRGALATYNRIGDNEGELRACNSLAKSAYLLGKYVLAKEFLERALVLSAALSDTNIPARIRGNLGRISIFLGEFIVASNYLDPGTTAITRLPPHGKCNWHVSFGQLLVSMRDFNRAADHLEQALTIAVAHTFAREKAIYHEYAGEMAFWQGEYDEAEEHYRAAIKIGMEIAPEGDLISQSYRLLAELQVERGEVDKAAESCDCAWRVAEKISERVEMGAIQRTRGAIAIRRGDTDEAKAAFADAVRILSEIGAKYELARTHLLAAEADMFETAYRLLHLAPAEVLFRDIGVQWWTERVGKSLDRLTGGRSFAACLPAPEENDNGAGPFIGVSKPMRDLLARVDAVKNQDDTLLLCGETGAGKDRLAEYIHHTGSRADKPFEHICATTIPADLWESELFGHAKGSFSGAATDKIGLLARADGGTVYFNEISEIPISIQAKFLQFLDTKEIRPIGTNQSIKLDLRIIASTNRNVPEAIASREFRNDLYFRLSGFRFQIPPLRDRREDIPALVEHFLSVRNLPEREIRRLLDSPVGGLFQQASWPGNVRQLKTVVNRLVTFFNGADDDQLEALAREILANENLLPNPERDELINLLEANDWNQRATAREMGVSHTTISRKIKQFNINPPGLRSHG